MKKQLFIWIWMMLGVLLLARSCAGTLDPASGNDYGSIGFDAGIVLHAKYGAQVRSGDPLMTLYAADEARLDAAERRLAGAVEISAEAPPERPLIHAKYAGREMG